MTILLRPIFRLPFISPLFGNNVGFRRIHGGKWARTFVDNPVYAVCWLPVPMRATHEYREPGWVGPIILETWP